MKFIKNLIKNYKIQNLKNEIQTVETELEKYPTFQSFLKNNNEILSEKDYNQKQEIFKNENLPVVPYSNYIQVQENIWEHELFIKIYYLEELKFQLKSVLA